MERFQTTPAQENYIEAIYRLASQDGPVRPSVLADSLGLKRASISKFLAKLVDQGLVYHQSHGAITLTKQGVALAEALIRRKVCLSRLLEEVCHMDGEQALAEAHRLEHVISEEVLIRLETLVDFACSSEAWLKRLRLRMASACESQASDPGAAVVGRSRMHQGETPGEAGKDKEDN